MKIILRKYFIVFISMMFITLILGYIGSYLNGIKSGKSYIIGATVVSIIVTILLAIFSKIYKVLISKRDSETNLQFQLQSKLQSQPEHESVSGQRSPTKKKKPAKLNSFFIVISMPISLASMFFEWSSLGIVNINNYIIDSFFMIARHLWSYMILIWFLYSVYVFISTIAKKQKFSQAVLALLFVIQQSLVFLVILFFGVQANLFEYVSKISNLIPILTLFLPVYIILRIRKRHRVKLESKHSL